VSATATQMSNACKNEVGYREGPHNDNLYGRWYGMNHEPYCAIGLTYCAYEIGAQSQIGGKWAYCPYWADWFRRRGHWAKSTPARGDIVFFDWTGQQRYEKEQHVGFVLERVDSTHIKTVEFNTVSGTGDQSDGGGVFVRTRHIQYVVGYGKVDWVPEKNVVIVPSKAGKTILVVDGVWGSRTTSRMQQLLHLKVTGVLDDGTLRAVAGWLRQTPTGTFTMKMKTALQYRVGVDQDGSIGPVTVRALQRYLNRVD
jgi:hypothetical protein